ncbi:hypothetical protein GGI20_001141 [Coemansia sp. BCRC 34301]|nr:hypothetical protein GGI20_001141 [Coemansia sp. BCRC 34301]
MLGSGSAGIAYPAGIPTPPPGLEQTFKRWAQKWHADNLGQLIPHELRELLLQFTAGLLVGEALDCLVQESKCLKESQEAYYLAREKVESAEGKPAKKHAKDALDAAKENLNDNRDHKYYLKLACIWTKDEIGVFLGSTIATQGQFKPVNRAKVLLVPLPYALPSFTIFGANVVKPKVVHSYDAHLVVHKRWDADVWWNPSNIEFGETAHLGNSVGPWHASNEQSVMGYFAAEFWPGIWEVAKVARPEAELLPIQGNTSYFIQAHVENESGQKVLSSVAVEFRLPYGQKIRLAYGSTQSPDWARMAEMPSAKLGWEFAMQLDKYMSEGSSGAPDAVKGTVNPRFGIASTYNETWIFEARSKDGSPLWAKAELPTHPREASEMTISSCFKVVNADPCIAAVFAYLLIVIIDDMKAKSEYAQVGSEE